MASFRSQLEQHLAHQIYAIYDEEDPVTIPEAVFARVMVFDARKISDSTIRIFNNSTTDSIDYQIFGTNKFVDLDNSQFSVSDPENEAPAVDDDSWINLLSKCAEDLTVFDQEKFKTIPARTSTVGNAKETFSNKWSYVQILARTSNIGVTAKIWHRGTNEH